MREVAVNETGLRIGEDHPNAKLTDSEIERIRSLHEDDGLSYKCIAEIYEVSKGSIAKICRYERRGQFPTNWQKLPTDEDIPRIEELRAEGMPWLDIGRTLGLRNVQTTYERMTGQQEEAPNEQ